MKYLALILFLQACTFGVDHKVKVALDLEDECLTMFPDCSTLGTSDTESFFCVDNDGALAPGCQATCLFASSRMCGEEGPECLQVGEQVPVFCMKVE